MGWIAGATIGAAFSLAATAALAAPSMGDRDTPTSVVVASYAAISGPAGTPRDFERLRALCLPDVRFVMVSRGPDGAASVQTLNFDEFAKGFGDFLQGRAFYEREVRQQVEGFAEVATVISTYESAGALAGAPFARGLNSYQLVRTGDGWRIQSLLWEDESPGAPLPGRYLPRR